MNEQSIPVGAETEVLAEGDGGTLIEIKEKNRFGGQVGNKVSDFDPPTKSKMDFEQKHLHSFLQGYTQFKHGKTESGHPAWHQVLRVE